MAALRETVSDHWPKPRQWGLADWLTVIPTAIVIGLGIGGVIGVLFFSVLASARKARAHEWYPISCCSGKDCYAIDASEIRAVPGGWLVIRTNETIPVRGYSPDGLYHRCSYGGDRDAKTICLFIPLPAGS